MDIPKHIQDSAYNTIGYKEAKHKESFLVGAQVAFVKAEEYYKSRIEALERSLDRTMKEVDEVKGDMGTLISILNKYDYEK